MMDGKMLKGYYIHFNARDTLGVSNKIDMQLKEMRKYSIVEEIDIRLATKSLIRNITGVLPFGSLAWDYAEAYQKVEKPDYIYIRKINGDRKLYLFLKHIRRDFPNCKILIEIHTYPYYQNMLKSVSGIVFLIKDYINYRKIAKLIDRIVTFSDDQEIFHVPTIQTINGIDVQSVCPVEKLREKDSKEISMIAVAMMGKYHGYERIFNGLKEYYEHGGSHDFQFHIVGEGSVKNEYMKLVKELGIEKHVVFWGVKMGEDLHEIYCKADLAISTLAWYKVGIKRSSALKVREYLAKGLPVVTGCREDAFDGSDTQYYCQFPNDSSNIDMLKVEKFYHQIYDGVERSQVISDVRKFAMKHVDIQVAMKPVMDFLIESK
ncbi:MAG: glycosyltransferase [Lachnospiraceae bacterium]|nr:glycosyltransferase [Lachnospiraceae bacterium]